MPVLAATASCGAGMFALAGAGRRSAHFLKQDEQLRVETLTEARVHNGPGVKILNPVGYRSAKKSHVRMLGNMDYAKVMDQKSGEVRVERGPKLFFPGAYDDVSQFGTGRTLSQTEYLTVEDKLTGHKSTVRGPCVWFPGPYDQASAVKTAIVLQEDEYVRLKDEATGTRWVQRGRALVFLEPTWNIEVGVSKAWTVKAYEYVRLLDKVSGKVCVHRGEQTVFPGPDEELLDATKLTAIDLQADEYIRIEDQSSGEMKVERGVGRVFLGANERVVGNGKEKSVQVDEEHAVLVRDMGTGQARLVTDKQLFAPGPRELIEEVRELIKLADHEAIIVKDLGGNFFFHRGTTSFFLQPYEKVVQLCWSSGLRRKTRNLRIDRFDCRAQYMWFEFDCRTSDNVELVLECTFFWEVTDLAKLVRSTGDLPGDIYNEARSQFIKKVAHKTLKAFMEQLHSISSEVFHEGASFYEDRGVHIHRLEVTRFQCSEERTSEVLQQIIEETTNRLNRLSQAESENEVKIFKMQGQLEQEKLNTDLLRIQHEHANAEAQAAGAAEAERVKSFVTGLAEGVPNLENRIDMWKVLRKTDALSVVSAGGASLYYTPNDVNLSIETKHVDTSQA